MYNSVIDVSIKKAHNFKLIHDRTSKPFLYKLEGVPKIVSKLKKLHNPSY